MGIWYSMMPNKEDMLYLETYYKPQHDYLKLNMLFYIISISCYGANMCCLLILPPIGLCLAALLGLWALGIIIWTLCNTSTVYGKEWKQAVLMNHDIDLK